MKKIVAVMLVVGTAWSLAEGFGTLQARVPGSNNAYLPIWLQSMNATVTISDQIAVTYVNQVFTNTSGSTEEGIFSFTLPVGSVITELALWINGVRTPAKAIPTTQATSIYDSSVRKSVDPALLIDSANNNYTIYVYPIGAAGDSAASRRIDFTYVTPLQSSTDTTAYTLPLVAAGSTPQAPRQTEVTISGRRQDTIVNVLAPGFQGTPPTISRPDQNSFTLSYTVDSAFTSQALTVDIACTHSPLYRLTAESYVPMVDTVLPFDSAGDASYFALWLDAPLPTSVKNREVVFVADISYSMGDSGLSLLKTTLLHAVSALTPNDRFNIIAFNTGFTEFMSGLVTATPDEQAAAVAYIDSLKVRGITNFIDPMKAAGASAWSAGANHGIFLLTDGYPTWPVRLQTAGIIDTITAYNGGGAPVFCIGIGTTANQTFLSLLAQGNNGSYASLTAPDTGQGGLSTILTRMLSSYLSNIRLSYGALDTAGVYPTQLPNLYNGSRIGVMGRYKKTGIFPVIVSARQNGVPFLDTLAMTLPVAYFNNTAIPQLWASQEVNALLGQIAVQGPLAALTGEVTYLGLRYGIVTPYTALLVTPGTQAATSPTATKPGGGAGLIRTMALSASWSATSRQAVIRYDVPNLDATVKNVSLKIYDLRGELVRTLVQQETAGGRFTACWNCSSKSGRPAGAGCFIVVLEVENKRLVRALHIAW
jgi:Ca-activated chloride channel family protein